MTVLEQISGAQERVLTDVQTAQTRMVEMNQRFADAAEKFLPKVELPSTDSFPSVDDLPKREELVSTYFDFAAKMMAANRTFVEQIVGVWAPAETKATKSAKAKA